MQNIKQSLFLYLTPRQKSQLLGTLKSYFKKFPFLNKNELCDKFLEDEKYYLDINNPHFEFMGQYFENDEFYRDMEKFFDFCEYERTQKEKLKPYLDKQKELARLARKKASDLKMSKLKPTKRQLNYYDKITRAHNIRKKDTENATRLDLRNWIMEIIDEYNKEN